MESEGRRERMEGGREVGKGGREMGREGRTRSFLPGLVGLKVCGVPESKPVLTAPRGHQEEVVAENR